MAADTNADICAALDELRELVERAAEAGVDADLIERNAADIPRLLLELAEHRRNASDPRRAKSIEMGERMLAAKRNMRRAGWGPREINRALRERFGLSRSRTNTLLAEAEAACVLPGHFRETIDSVPQLALPPEAEK